MISPILVINSGRCGSLYLNEVFIQHKSDNNEVYTLHEEAGRDPWYSELRKIANGDEGLFLSGRNVASYLLPELKDCRPRFVFLIRKCQEVCASWYERIPASHYNPEHIAGRWPFGNPMGPFQREWTEYQAYLWHWYGTYHVAMEMAEHYPYHLLRFDDLNDVKAINDLFLYTGFMTSCNEETLTACRSSAQNAKTVYRSADDIDHSKEVYRWMHTISAVWKYNHVVEWLAEIGGVL